MGPKRHSFTFGSLTSGFRWPTPTAHGPCTSSSCADLTFSVHTGFAQPVPLPVLSVHRRANGIPITFSVHTVGKWLVTNQRRLRAGQRFFTVHGRNTREFASFYWIYWDMGRTAVAGHFSGKRMSLIYWVSWYDRDTRMLWHGITNIQRRPCELIWRRIRHPPWEDGLRRRRARWR